MFRIALLFLFALLSYAPESQAIACQTNDYALKPGNCTQGQAYQACQSALATGRSRGLPVSAACTTNGNPGYTGSCGTTSNPTTQNTCNFDTGFFFNYVSGTTCASRPAITGTGNFYPANDGDLRCANGCVQSVAETSEGFTLTNTGGLCAVETWGPSNCPANHAWSPEFKTCSPLPPDADGDGIPDADDQWPFDPQRSLDSDQDGVEDSFDAFPKDPTEQFDADSDGIGDNSDVNDSDANNGKDLGAGNETNNTSTGGGSCSSPPVSTGEAITAQIAYQTWATRCAAEQSNAKLDEVKAAIQAQGSGGGSGGGSVTVNVSNSLDANSNGTPDYLEGSEADLSGEPTGEEALESSAAADTRAQDALNSIDSSGFLANSSCPGLPPIHVMGQTFDMSQQVCDQASIFAGLIQAFAMFAAAVIIARGMSY